MIYKLFWIIRAILLKPFFCKLGLPSYIGRPIFLSGTRRISIGSRSRIFPGSRIEAHKGGKICIGNNVSIGENLHIISSKSIIIEDGVLMAENIFIADSDHSYEDISIPVHEQELLIKSTHIGENCFIGVGSAILAGTKLGRNCVVGACSVVRGDFPDYSVLAGNPARVIKLYNKTKQTWESV